MGERNANLEKLHEGMTQTVNGLKSQLNQSRLQANDLAAEKKAIEQRMLNLNIELQKIRL